MATYNIRPKTMPSTCRRPAEGIPVPQHAKVRRKAMGIGVRGMAQACCVKVLLGLERNGSHSPFSVLQLCVPNLQREDMAEKILGVPRDTTLLDPSL